MQEVLSTLLLGSGRHLRSAADASSACQQCVSVVWFLQVSIGYALPTLLVWRAQLQAARKWAEEQGAREAPRQPRRRPGELSTVVEMELASSQYATVCSPALQLARSFPGGTPTVVAVAGMFAWLAAVLLRAKWAGSCNA